MSIDAEPKPVIVNVSVAGPSVMVTLPQLKKKVMKPSTVSRPDTAASGSGVR